MMASSSSSSVAEFDPFDPLAVGSLVRISEVQHCLPARKAYVARSLSWWPRHCRSS